jgi:hypothetical protein
MLATGQIEAGIAGGVEFLTDVPIRYNRKVCLSYSIFIPESSGSNRYARFATCESLAGKASIGWNVVE